MRQGTLVLVALYVAVLGRGAPLQAQDGPGRLISFEEIDRARASMGGLHTAYDVVRMLRPRWLQMRDPLPTTPVAANPPVRVYVDDVGKGGAEFLETIPVETVLDILWLSSNDAAARYGTPDGLFAIAVRLKH